MSQPRPEGMFKVGRISSPWIGQSTGEKSGLGIKARLTRSSLVKIYLVIIDILFIFLVCLWSAISAKLIIED
jgi:hypothetical protein